MKKHAKQKLATRRYQGQYQARIFATDYSHFSLVRTISGKEKNFTIENYLLVRNFLKHAGFHLFYPLQSFWAKNFFLLSRILVSERFLYNTGFPL